jgi:hypothetical protein
MCFDELEFIYNFNVVYGEGGFVLLFIALWTNF